MDLHHNVATVIQSKNIRVRWMLGHREASSARDAQELDDMRRNNEVDRLAMLVTSLPLPLHNPTCPSSISVRGTEARTAASKWIAATGPYHTYQGLHWSTRLPPPDQHMHIWVQCMWGNVCWLGCPPPPWEKTKVLCPLCDQWHRRTPHARLV